MNMAATQLRTLPLSTVRTEYLTSKQIQPEVNHEKAHPHHSFIHIDVFTSYRMFKERRYPGYSL